MLFEKRGLPGNTKRIVWFPRASTPPHLRVFLCLLRSLIYAILKVYIYPESQLLHIFPSLGDSMLSRGIIRAGTPLTMFS